MPRKSRVAAVATAVASGDFRGALGDALVAWRAARCALLADLIDALAVRCPEVGIGEHNAEAYQEAWLRMASSRPSPVAIGALAATATRRLPLPDVPFGVRDRDLVVYRPLLDRIEALAGLPDDPRIATAMLDLLERAPFQLQTNRIYEPAIELLVHIADERSVPRLRALIDRPTAKQATVRELFAQVLPAAADKIEGTEPGQLEDAEREIIAGLLARLDRRRAAPAHRDAEQLFEECIVDLDDDGPREVLADALLEREDPRGEFIHLQLRAARGQLDSHDRRRMAALLREHEKTWIGPDLSTVTKRRVWSRGFLDSAELQRNAVADTGTWARATEDPRLATLRSLGKGSGNAVHYRQFVESKHTRSLAEIDVLDLGMAERLRGLGKPLEHVIVELPYFSEAMQHTLGELLAHRAFRRLTFSAQATVDDVIARIAGWPAHTQLTELMFAPAQARWLQHWSNHGEGWLTAHERLGIARLGIRFADSLVIAERAGTRLAIEHDGDSRHLARLLATLRLQIEIQ